MFLLCFVLCSLTVSIESIDWDCTYWKSSTSPKISVVSGPDFYSIQLMGGLNTEAIDQWEVRNSAGTSVTRNALTFGKVLEFSPHECEETQYTVVMTARCPNAEKYGSEEVFLDTLELQPIPLDQSSSFKRSDYAQLRSQIVKTGERATLTCQTEDDAKKLYGSDFVPYYTWLKEVPFSSDEPVLSGPSHNNTLVLDSVSCGDAGYYYCKVTKCSYHPLKTGACNNNDVAVQAVPPTIDYRKCKIFGDPHVITFDGSMYNYKGQCWYVLAMDAKEHAWFVYGYFTSCGDASSCLESLSLITKGTKLTSKARIELLRGYGMSLDGEKTFIKRDAPETYKNVCRYRLEKSSSKGTVIKIIGFRNVYAECLENGISMLFSGNSLEMSVPEFGLQIKWDGLAAVTIRVTKDAPTKGLCGDNNGDASNDYSSYFDRLERNSDAFADAWSIGSAQCTLSKDVPEESLSSLLTLEDLLKAGANPTTFPASLLRKICTESVYGSKNSDTQLTFVANQLPKEKVDAIIDACIMDIRGIEYGFFDKRYNFAGCIVLQMLADEAEDLGICVEDWQVTARCPLRVQWREESIRIGCLWYENDYKIVRS